MIKQKIIPLEQLQHLPDSVLCHGVFDILHAGHLAYFEAARKYGPLVVSVTADRYVNKGPNRPYFTHAIRAKMIAALNIVDYVVISDFPTAKEVIKALRPKVYVKGPDYKDHSKDVSGEIKNEVGLVEAQGGRVVYTEDETHSSSQILNRFFVNWNDEQLKTIEMARSFGEEKIFKIIEEMKSLRVLVVGEPILDIYRFCTPEGISSKSPTISARFQYEERYLGGAWAIKNHLKDFCHVEKLWVCEAADVPKKIRYIDKSQRVFEVTKINEACWKPKWEEIPKDLDLLIAADFGHGLLEGEALERIRNRAFLALNVQTNSSNYGFNLFQKHKHFDYLCLDTKEARLALHDKIRSPQDLAWLIYLNHQAFMSLTLGPNGAIFLGDGKEYASPAFVDNIVDAIGAGDAYFAITSALLKVGCPLELIPFLGNVFAGLKTKIIGNKAPVTKASFLKAISSILK